MVPRAPRAPIGHRSGVGAARNKPRSERLRKQNEYEFAVGQPEIEASNNENKQKQEQSPFPPSRRLLGQRAFPKLHLRRRLRGRSAPAAQQLPPLPPQRRSQLSIRQSLPLPRTPPRPTALSRRGAADGRGAPRGPSATAVGHSNAAALALDTPPDSPALAFAAARRQETSALYTGGERGEAGHGREHKVTSKWPNRGSRHTTRTNTSGDPGEHCNCPNMVGKWPQMPPKIRSGSRYLAHIRPTFADWCAFGQKLTNIWPTAPKSGRGWSNFGQRRPSLANT